MSKEPTGTDQEYLRDCWSLASHNAEIRRRSMPSKITASSTGLLWSPRLSSLDNLARGMAISATMIESKPIEARPSRDIKSR